MIILLLSALVLIQISILFLIYLIYKQKAIINVNKNVKQFINKPNSYLNNKNEIIEINQSKSELIKQIIAFYKKRY